jgi:pentatricopeptide repeat protein
VRRVSHSISPFLVAFQARFSPPAFLINCSGVYELCIEACTRAGDGVSALALFEALQSRGLETQLTIEKVSVLYLAFS